MPPTIAPATRERILVYLQEHRLVCARDLSHAWGLTRADIRHHLNALLEEGLIELAPLDTTRPTRRGRPEQWYRLAAGRAPDNLAALAAALLDSLAQSLSAADRDAFLTTLAGHLAPPGQPDEPATRRFNQAVAYLENHGYRARWEAHADGPRILLHNCPYAEIITRHPELCLLDRRLIEQLSGIPMHQTAQMNLETGKPPACIFNTGLPH